MLITKEIFQAFLNCETKSYLKFSGAFECQSEYGDWRHQIVEEYKQKCTNQLRSNTSEDKCLLGMTLRQAFNNRYSLIIDCMVQTNEFQSHIHALERETLYGKIKRNAYIPIRFVSFEKITKHDKLLLAFDGLVLSKVLGKMPPFGKIIYGNAQKTMRVKFAGLMKATQSVVERIARQQTNSATPQLILNSHCVECEFQSRCHQIAIEKDELSLLSGMTKKERKKYHDKGIFTVTQLSYNFHLRKKPKRLASQLERYNPALRALALRERKIHIVGKPELKTGETLIYLDVEGIPDRDFYYLIGLRIKKDNSYLQHSFWANDLSEERKIWFSFLRTLAEVENPQIIHYGSFEGVFLKRMKERYGAAIENNGPLDQLISKSVNLLSVIYAQIYFPTYSNRLKDIAKYLGFQWSDSAASGLNALKWRYEWESFRDSSLEQKIVTYNSEDCAALEKVANTVAQLCQQQTTELTQLKDGMIVHAELLEREYPRHLGDITFATPELEYINQAAYWDYQREKVYIRSSCHLKRISRGKSTSRAHLLPVNKVIECPPPSCCSVCKATRFLKRNKRSKVVYDIQFSRTGMKRLVLRFIFYSYLCCECGAIFFSQQRPNSGEKYGFGILAYMIYQIIELQLPQLALAKNLNQLFSFDMERTTIKRQKTRAAQIYKGTYETIVRNLLPKERA